MGGGQLSTVETLNGRLGAVMDDNFWGRSEGEKKALLLMLLLLGVKMMLKVVVGPA